MILVIQCSMVCQQMGRHVHVDFCRTTLGACAGANHQHITVRMLPEPAKAKDFVSHELYWRRTGTLTWLLPVQALIYRIFVIRIQRSAVWTQERGFSTYSRLDPYSHDDRETFAKWYVVNLTNGPFLMYCL